MSPHPDERGPAPDDHLLVRPYAPASAHSGEAPPPPPVAVATSVWPLDPFSGPVPGSPVTTPARPQGPDATSPSGSGPADGPGRRRSRLPLAVLALVALASAGGLLFLLRGPAPEPAPGASHPELALPALPARSPGAGESPEPGATGAAGTASPAASGSGPAAPSRGTPSAGARPSGNPATRPADPGPSAPAAKPPKAPSGTLRPGDRGPEVRALQERLYGQGFTYVSPTGVYDDQTRRGVAQLQRDRDIKGDPKGVYGPATRAAFD